MAHVASPYRPTLCPVLRSGFGYAMSGTEAACADRVWLMSGTETAYGDRVCCNQARMAHAGKSDYDLDQFFNDAGTRLRAPYAVSGTDIGYGEPTLVPAYAMPRAMSSTDIAYGEPTLRSTYAMPGTDVLYREKRSWYLPTHRMCTSRYNVRN
eukprot:2680738-Rhodomonas_salina.2